MFTTDLRRYTRMQCACGESGCFDSGANRGVRVVGQPIGGYCVSLPEAVDDTLDLNTRFGEIQQQAHV